MAPSPHLLAVCTTRALQPRTRRDDTPSGIDKAEVGEAVLTPLGVEGDRVLDRRFHGGVDKAVYAYADEDAAWWAARIGEDVWPGRFGENLRTRGVDVTGAVIGERWQVGAALLEVSEPRQPCSTFAHHMDDRPGWVRDFTAEGRCGAYLRVIEGATVRGGDPIRVVHRPAHGVTIGDVFSRAAGRRT